MITVRNTQLFNELKKSPKWNTLFDGTNLKAGGIPVLAGGLDHIEIKQKGIYFHDIGRNGHDNSFVIRSEVENAK